MTDEASAPTNLETLLHLSDTNSEEIYNKTISIFAKPKEKRVQREMKLAAAALARTPFFLSLDKQELEYNEILMNNFNKLGYEVLNKGDAVFHHGEKGNKFYIILKGSVTFFTPKTDEEIQNELNELDKAVTEMANTGHMKNITKVRERIQKCRERIANKEAAGSSNSKTLESLPSMSKFRKQGTDIQLLTIFQSLARKSNNSEATENLSKFRDYRDTYFEDIICKFKTIRSLADGGYFGELALTSNLARSATAVASSELHLVSLSKDVYAQLFKDIQDKLQEKIKFFAKLLNQDTNDNVIKLSYAFKEKHYKYGQKIFSQGELPTEIYVVKQGEVEITRSEVTDKQEQNKRAYMLKERKITETKIAKLIPYDLLGEGEIKSKQPYNINAISVTNETVLYVLSLTEYRLIKPKFYFEFKILFDKYKTKAEYWNSRVEGISQVNQMIERDYRSLIQKKNKKNNDTTILTENSMEKDLPDKSHKQPSVEPHEARQTFAETLFTPRTFKRSPTGEHLFGFQATTKLHNKSNDGIALQKKVNHESHYILPSLFSDTTTFKIEDNFVEKERNEPSEKIKQVLKKVLNHGDDYMTSKDAFDAKSKAAKQFIMEKIEAKIKKLHHSTLTNMKQFKSLRPYEVDALRAHIKNKSPSGNDTPVRDLTSTDPTPTRLHKKNHTIIGSDLKKTFTELSDERLINKRSSDAGVYGQDFLNIGVANSNAISLSPQPIPMRSEVRKKSTHRRVLDTSNIAGKEVCVKCVKPEIQERRLDIAHLELAAPFSRKKIPYALSLTNGKTSFMAVSPTFGQSSIEEK